MASITLPAVGSDEARREFPIHEKSGLSLPTHYFWMAIQLTGLVFLIGAILFVIEYAIGIAYTSRGAATQPLQLATRVMGFAHYTIATYFLLTSKRIRNARGIATLILFLVLSTALCYLFTIVGGYTNKVAYISVGLVFLVHGLRDETFFYRQRSGKALTDEEYPYVYKMLIWLQVATLLLVAGLLYPVYIYGLFHVRGHAKIAYYTDALMPGAPYLVKFAAVGLPFAAVGVAITYWIHRRHPGGLVSLLRSHAPFSIILGTYLGLTALTLVFGTGILFLGIMFHYVGWFIFAANGISKKPVAEQKAVTWKTPDKWIRNNLTGFLVFHFGLIAFFLALIGFNHWVLSDARSLSVMGSDIRNPFSLLLDKKAFISWTIFHLVLAFMPKPKLGRG